MIEAGKLIVLNKFSPVEARVTFLLEALHKIEIDQTLLDDRRKAFLNDALSSQEEGNSQEQIETVGQQESSQESSE